MMTVRFERLAVVQALQAKAKLDSILKDCGKAVDSRSSTNTKLGKEMTDPSSPTAASAGAASCKRRAATKGCSEECKDKRRKHSERDDEATVSME